MMPDDTNAIVDMSIDTIFTLLVDFKKLVSQERPCSAARLAERQAMRIGDAFDCT